MNSEQPLHDYVRPESVSEAVIHLSQGGWRVVAGGTDIYPTSGNTLKMPMLDLMAIPGLRGVSMGECLRIGAATTWTDIAEAALPASLLALQQAARHVGGRQIQNAATLSGNLCNASPAADGVPPLLVVNAIVELVSTAGTRLMPLNAFLRGPRQTALNADEILTAILIPQAFLSGRSAFLKLGARTHLVISIAMVAVRVVLVDLVVAEVSIAVGSCSGTAQRLPLVERALTGAALPDIASLIRSDDVAAALSPIDDVRASAGYRIRAVTELVSRAVMDAST